MSTMYKSKIGIEIAIPLIIIFGVTIYLSKDGYSIWTALIVVAVLAFIVYLFSNTYYIIKETTLLIKSAFLINIAIDIETITEISETNNMLSAPALSLDRLKITYENTKSVLVSPEEKFKFIEELLSINPKLRVVYKK